MDMAPAGVHKRRWSAGPTARREGPWLVGWLVGSKQWHFLVTPGWKAWLSSYCCSRAVKI